jgi:hypothetical protein
VFAKNKLFYSQGWSRKTSMILGASMGKNELWKTTRFKDCFWQIRNLYD